jgi:hypothetical protein
MLSWEFTVGPELLDQEFSLSWDLTLGPEFALGWGRVAASSWQVAALVESLAIDFYPDSSVCT